VNKLSTKKINISVKRPDCQHIDATFHLSM